ncbi:MAG: 2,3-bisphosphoglycerate-independent phosphoglycerate mutase [Planctomycetota bacterium]
MPEQHPVVLIIRDGWGRNPHTEHDSFNAVKLASTPVADRLMHDWPSTLIRTCGEDVGLPDGVMGNSEVGHQNIGAGRVVDQEVMRITRAIRDGAFADNAAFKGAFEHATRHGGRVHLLGLVSDGLVHSDLNHLLALLDLAEQQAFPADRLLVHAIMDGRDTAPRGGLGYLTRVQERLERTGGRIATVMGRYYAMDRDNRWERIAIAYSAMTGCPHDPPVQTATSALDAISRYYEHPSDSSRQGDEFIVPVRIVEDGEPAGLVEQGDAVVFFNFRGDRPRQLSRAFVLDEQAWAEVPDGGFDRGARLADVFFCTMTAYEQGLPVTAVAFEKPPKMPDILGQIVSSAGLTQFRCAETEKYAHVTFFFNDYREDPFDGERRLLVPSPKDVGTYDQKPEMSAHAVAEGVLARLAADDVESLIVVNFANPDMVGHTGSLPAVIRAVEVVDEQVGRVVDATLRAGGSVLVTADHGNAEQMWDPVNDCPHTAHTTNDVPLILVGEGLEGHRLRDGGRLADIAPTLLVLMGLEPPAAMTGQSLLEKKRLVERV